MTGDLVDATTPTVGTAVRRNRGTAVIVVILLLAAVVMALASSRRMSSKACGSLICVMWPPQQWALTG